MEKYSSYKDSGVDWLGEIPKHWDVKKIRHILSLANEKTKESGGELLSLSQYVGITKKTESNVGIRAAEDTTGYNVVHKGQFVMNIMLAWNGSYAVSEYDGIISPAYCVFDFTRECDKRYYNYLLRMKAYSGAFKTESKGIIDSRLRLYPQYFKNFPLIVPPIEEQRSMATYLDKITAGIDKAIAQQQNKIDLLNERKQIIIQRTVTKGLNEKVKMKNSGIDWLGEIPIHWDVKKIRHILSLANEKTKESGGELLSLSQYVGVTKKTDSDVGIRAAEDTTGYNVVHKGQFVMNIMLAWNGSYAVSEYDGIISPAYCIFDFTRECNKRYYNYLLRMKAYSGAFKTESKGIIDSRLRLYPQYFKNFPLIVPPIEEQQSIATYLDNTTTEIDKAIDRLQNMLSLLQERKQIIISEVVTGKIKVS